MNAIIVILLAILFSAFFSGMEIAFVSSNKLRIELDKKQGVFGSEIIKIFTNNPGKFIATMLIGNNIALVIYGLFFSRLLGPVLTPVLDSDLLTLIVNTIISTAIILLVAEFLPKTIFIISPNFFLKTLSVPTLFFYWIFYPISKFTLAASNFFIKILFKNKPGEKVRENIVFSKVDLDHFVNLSKQSLEESEPFHHNIRIFQNALDFSNVKLRECMVPRTEIDAVECGSPVAELKEKFIETQHSRILVYNETIDNIIGYFELKDIFRNPPDIKSSIRKLAIVPETMAANKLLKVFVDEKKNIALVVDEFGGTSGIVTIEDVLEEIVGDIEDEHDTNELIEKIIGNNEYVFSGRLEIDYLNEKYHLGLPEEDDYETLAGMILYHHGSIPGINDIIRIRNLVFRIIKTTPTRVELVNLKIDY
ncbi:MAG: hemolysin family protein [Bacteroidales bacterium]|jgi:CBS domain containing-hemolysin-like protein|nr:hemolysin family protein [Bacteroidales bacterium]